jgi:hypothetical protein
MHPRLKIRGARSFTGSAAGRCSLCDRTAPLTFHHLIPRKVHRRKYFQKHYTRSQLARGIDICRLCHDGIHDLYDEMTLARSLRTLLQLRNDPRIRKHVAWVRKQKRR